VEINDREQSSVTCLSGRIVALKGESSSLDRDHEAKMSFLDQPERGEQLWT
jgi:hypothetical protein